MTVQNLIDSAALLIGLIQSGQSMNIDESTDALSVLNAMLANWNTQHITIYTIQNKQFALVGGTGAYTIGATGDFDTPRPVKIESAGIVQANGLRSILDMINSKQFAEIPEKSARAVQPLKLYNDNDYPLSKLYLWPVPSGTPTLDLFMWEEIEGFTTLAATFDLPPGYWKAIRFNLAVELANEYGREPGQITVAVAQQSKNELAGLNVSNVIPSEDPPAAPAPQPAQQQGPQ